MQAKEKKNTQLDRPFAYVPKLVQPTYPVAPRQSRFPQPNASEKMAYGRLH